MVAVGVGVGYQRRWTAPMAMILLAASFALPVAVGHHDGGILLTWLSCSPRRRRVSPSGPCFFGSASPSSMGSSPRPSSTRRGSPATSCCTWRRHVPRSRPSRSSSRARRADPGGASSRRRPGSPSALVPANPWGDRRARGRAPRPARPLGESRNVERNGEPPRRQLRTRRRIANVLASHPFVAPGPLGPLPASDSKIPSPGS